MKSETVSVSELTIGAIADLRAALLAAFEQGDQVSIDVQPEARADIAGAQLMISAKSYAELKGKAVRLTRPADGNLRDVLEKAGFLAGDAGERAFWLNEEVVQ
ncbi:MAG: STAS domain-containing protein [Hyphomicrobiales bacterium]|nr:MAG: STAS domain-containing protein [Hyphomicrobiales bacterium]